MLLLHDQHVTSDLVSELQTVRALLRANGLVGCRWCTTGGREHSATGFLAVHFVTQILAFADPQFVEVVDFTQATLWPQQKPIAYSTFPVCFLLRPCQDLRLVSYCK